jgi:hypothetical protein
MIATKMNNDELINLIEKVKKYNRDYSQQFKVIIDINEELKNCQSDIVRDILIKEMKNESCELINESVGIYKDVLLGSVSSIVSFCSSHGQGRLHAAWSLVKSNLTSFIAFEAKIRESVKNPSDDSSLYSSSKYIIEQLTRVHDLIGDAINASLEVVQPQVEPEVKEIKLEHRIELLESSMAKLMESNEKLRSENVKLLEEVNMLKSKNVDLDLAIEGHSRQLDRLCDKVGLRFPNWRVDSK